MIYRVIIILLYSISTSAYANCNGCCTSHGGVICLSGVTICKDETPLSRKCLKNKCYACGNYVKNKKKTSRKKAQKKFTIAKTLKYLNSFYKRKGGDTFFCNTRMKKKINFKFLNVVSNKLILKNIKSKSSRYNEIISDPVNFVPVNKRYFKRLYNKYYGEVKGEKRKFGKCNLEISKSIIEPKDNIKGDIARIFRYMETRYNLKLIKPHTANLFSLWELEDPINSIECQRVFNQNNGKFFGIFKNICE
jgi:endonuclease I